MQLSEEKSVKTTINIKKEAIISAGRVINMDKLVNKDFYNIIKNKVFVKPIGIHFWTTYLDIQDFQNITDLYEFIFKILLENKLKIFRWKLLQFIIPTKSHWSNGKYQLTVYVMFVKLKKIMIITFLCRVHI